MFFFFKQKTAYELRISDWSSDVCSSDLLLLMDEPFASLDAIVRTRITQDLLDWVDRETLTVLLVTHDLEEAISVSDSIYVLSQGPRAGIRGHHRVTIPRPRNLLETRRHPQFASLLDRLWEELSEKPAVPLKGVPA